MGENYVMLANLASNRIGCAILIILLQSPMAIAACVNGTTGKVVERITDSYGYEYTYKTQEVRDGTVGIVESYSPSEHCLIDRISFLPPAGCDINDFRKPKAIKFLGRKIQREIVILCGSDFGRQQTLVVLQNGKIVDKLNYGTSLPNIIWNNKSNSFIA